MTTKPGSEPSRRLFMILSPRSLAYARGGLQSLLANAIEPLHLRLITDTDSDKQLLLEEIAGYTYPGFHRCDVFAQPDLDDHESRLLGRYPKLRRFRHGHPCWRKIIDPLLLSSAEDEIVVLDPDLYFPNKFCFEPTPGHGLLLMWQRPNCLLPRAIVDAAMAKNIPLAHHVDIGVAQWRASVDLDWLHWLVGQLDLERDPNTRFSMHVEAIVWAAIAMRAGGGYLPAVHWHCWRRSQKVRMLRKLHVPGPELLRYEPFSTIKCFHAGGEAKYWLEAARHRGWLDSNKVLDRSAAIRPFVELAPATYRKEQAIKSWLRRCGYYNLFRSEALY